MLNKYLDYIRDVLNLIIIGIAIVERPGDGEEKKKEAIQIIQEIGRDLLPDWIVKLILNELTLGILIDYLVGRLNKANVFDHA